MKVIEFPETHRQLRRMLALRLGIGALLVGSLAGCLAYWVESYRVQQRTIDRAIAGVRHFELPAMQVAISGEKAEHPVISQSLTNEFVGVRVFSPSTEILFDAWRPLPESLKEVAQQQLHSWPIPPGSHSKRIPVADEELVQVIVPMTTNDGRLVGYVEGISLVSKSALHERRALLLLGDPGKGKGRLLHEFRTMMMHENPNIQWGVLQADQILRQSFNPIRYWLLRYFDIAAAESLEKRIENFETRMQRVIAMTPDQDLALELDRLRSMLAALVDLYWEGSLYETLDAKSRYNSTLAALIYLIEAESLIQPLVLVLEDAHYIDEDTLQFLPRLTRSTNRERPVPGGVGCYFPITGKSVHRRRSAGGCIDHAGKAFRRGSGAPTGYLVRRSIRGRAD